MTRITATFPSHLNVLTSSSRCPTSEIITKGPTLTAAERELARQEKSRKRKSQSDAKMEEEKNETINRLLKKSVQKRAPGGSRKKLAAGNVTGQQSDDDPEQPHAGPAAHAKGTRPEPAARGLARWVSTAEGSTWSVPGGAGEWGGFEKHVFKGYPPPRPPPPTRRFGTGAAQGQGEAMVIS